MSMGQRGRGAGEREMRGRRGGEEEGVRRGGRGAGGIMGVEKDGRGGGRGGERGGGCGRGVWEGEERRELGKGRTVMVFWMTQVDKGSSLFEKERQNERQEQQALRQAAEVALATPGAVARRVGWRLRGWSRGDEEVVKGGGHCFCRPSGNAGMSDNKTKSL
ncbi:unnamed protein product, partial [Closterium sp. NIES-65]